MKEGEGINPSPLYMELVSVVGISFMLRKAL